MKIIRQNQTKEFKNGMNCIAIEYPSDDKDINGAVIKLTGRYPETGMVVNLECKELAYVITGSGIVVINGEEINISEGDLITIEAGENFFWDGNLTMFMPCVPAWNLEQYREVK
jgi:mannose-6-phosphate isomerase-like protein (cupin superfamily)